jgi:hypothetical protein
MYAGAEHELTTGATVAAGRVQDLLRAHVREVVKGVAGGHSVIGAKVATLSSFFP